MGWRAASLRFAQARVLARLYIETTGMA